MARIWRTTDPEPMDAFSQESIYNGLDCCVTREVLDELKPQLDENTYRIYDFERELQAPILEMMLRGVKVNMNTRNELTALYEDQLKQLQASLDEICTEGLGVQTINPGSWQQKQWLLYEVLGLPHQRKRGKITTDRGALERLSSYFQAEPICNHIMALQDVRKKLGFLKTGIGPDRRCYTTFSISGTDTGRLSSYGSCWFDGTNMQNVAPEMRRMFEADEGMKFAYIDLEQAEARKVGAIIWNLFGDGHYLDFCESGDLHTNVTRMTWDYLPWTNDPSANYTNKDIAKQKFYREFSYRDAAKRLGHASNYHGQPPQISRETRIPVGLVQQFQLGYFKEFPYIPKWHEHVRTKLLRDGRITSLMGRPRSFFGRRWDNDTLNAAIAYDPQSSIADYLNRGLVAIWNDPWCRAHNVQLLLQVHDAVLIQYPEEYESEVIPRVQRLLEITVPLMNGRTLTIPTEAFVGWNWAYAYNDKKELINPDGIIAFTGNDQRRRSAPASFLDRVIR